MNRRQDASRYFDKVAPRWDAMRRTYFSERVRDLVLAEARAERGKLAADVGAGTGFITIGLIKLSLKVLAIDESLPMLRVLRSKTFGVSNLCLCIGEAERLPVRNCTVVCGIRRNVRSLSGIAHRDVFQPRLNEPRPHVRLFKPHPSIGALLREKPERVCIEVRDDGGASSIENPRHLTDRSCWMRDVV